MKFITLIFLVAAGSLAPAAHASKDGIYVGIGITTTSYRGNSSDSFVRVVEDERVTGWRGEVGYIWDLGKTGGFQMGVAGTFNDFGKVSNTEQDGPNTTDVSLDASALSVYFVIEQEMATWVDFVFKVGPSLINYEATSCCTAIGGRDIVDQRETRIGGTGIIGFTFFPTQHIGIELAAQVTSWLTGDLRNIETEDDFYDYIDSRVAARTLSASFQYRF